MRETFDAHGAVLLTNTGLTELSQMQPYVEAFIGAGAVYEGGANPREQLDPYFLEVGAPAIADLHYHHEMAYTGKSTKMLAFSARAALSGKAADGVSRGASFLSDNVAATEELMQTELGHQLQQRGLLYWRDLTDAEAYIEGPNSTVYNHWQLSFGTQDPVQAEQQARSAGLEVEWGQDPHRNHSRYMRTRYTVSAFEYCPGLDRNLLYASIADDAQWFDNWPGLDTVSLEHRPLKLTFGDGGEFTREQWEQWVALYDRHGFPIEWKQGDILVIDNYRLAHGRPGYEVLEGESRQLGVTLGQTFDRVGDLPDKW